MKNDATPITRPETAMARAAEAIRDEALGINWPFQAVAFSWIGDIWHPLRQTLCDVLTSPPTR